MGLREPFSRTDDARICAGTETVVRRAVGGPQDRELRRIAESFEGFTHEDRLRALGLGVAGTGGVPNGDDHGDSVSLRDRLTEATRGHYRAKLKVFLRTFGVK